MVGARHALKAPSLAAPTVGAATPIHGFRYGTRASGYNPGDSLGFSQKSFWKRLAAETALGETERPGRDILLVGFSSQPARGRGAEMSEASAQKEQKEGTRHGGRDCEQQLVKSSVHLRLAFGLLPFCRLARRKSYSFGEMSF